MSKSVQLKMRHIAWATALAVITAAVPIKLDPHGLFAVTGAFANNGNGHGNGGGNGNGNGSGKSNANGNSSSHGSEHNTKIVDRHTQKEGRSNAPPLAASDI